MKIAVDIKAQLTESKFRGAGYYTKNLFEALENYDRDNSYARWDSSKKLTKNFDLLIIPYFFPFNISLPIRKKIKTIVVIHDLIPLKFPDKFPAGLRGSLIWQLQRYLLKKVDAIITDSHVSQNDIINIVKVSSDKIFVVYPTVSTKFVPLTNNSHLKKIKDKYGLTDEFILYVGDCNWNKNIPSLIRACQKLNINLVLVGKVFSERRIDLNHPWNKSLKEVNKLTKNNKLVKKTGFVEEDDLMAIYNLASLYVQPSYYEGFGLSMVEAMKCGCPVLSSEGGSLKEIGGQDLLYFDPDNVDELTNKIKQVYFNPNLKKRLRTAGFLRAKQYAALNLVNNLKNVYRQII